MFTKLVLLRFGHYGVELSCEFQCVIWFSFPKSSCFFESGLLKIYLFENNLPHTTEGKSGVGMVLYPMLELFVKFIGGGRLKSWGY